MRYELFLAMRYLTGLRRSQPFVSVIAMISMLGVAVGVAALLIVLSVMSGFDADLAGKIVGSNPHLAVESEGGISDPEWVAGALNEIPGVLAVSPYAQTQVLLKNRQGATGVILRGVDPEHEEDVTRLPEAVVEGSWPPALDELVIGSELARRMGLDVGDKIQVIGGEKPSKKEMTVRAVFRTGMYEYDQNLVLCSVATVQGILEWKGIVSGMGVRIADPFKAPEIKQAIAQKLRYPFWAVSWMDMNRNLFAALKLEKLVMFIILTLIVLVACFNIIATVLMLVVGKRKEVGILRSIGATGVSVRRIFTWAGLMIGFIGTALGALIGIGLCVALDEYKFVQLPPEVYYIDHLPVRLNLPDAGTVAVSALAITWLACVYPSWLASRMQPAEALRYE